MITVKYCRAPSHNWIGWGWHDTGFYYSAGSTLDNLMQRFKANVYAQKRISASQCILDTKPAEVDTIPIDKMKPTFLTKYYYDRHEKSQPAKPATPIPAQPEYDYYEQEIVDGVLHVYGICRREVASYKLNQQPSTKGETDGIYE